MTGQAKVDAAQLRPPFGGDAPMIATGDARAEARIRLDLEHSVEVLLEAVSGVEAVMLAGGYARGEGTVRLRAEGPIPANDYDLVAVVGRVPGEAQRRRLQDRLAAELGMDLVDVRFVRSARLERLPFTMFWADLRRTGRVLWGDPDILGRLPAYNLARLPLVEGRKLLFNRLMCLIEAYPAEPLNDAAWFRSAHWLAKCAFACADAALISQGLYHSSYAEKIKRLKSMGMPEGESYSLGQWALACKLHGDPGSPAEAMTRWFTVRAVMRDAVRKHCARFYRRHFETLSALARWYPRAPSTLARRLAVAALERSRRYERIVALEAAELHLVEARRSANEIDADALEAAARALARTDGQTDTERTWDTLRERAIRAWYTLKH